MLYHNVRVMGAYLLFLDAVASAAVAAAILYAVDLVFEPSGGPVVAGGKLFVFCIALAGAFIAVGHRLNAYHARRTERVYLELVSLTEVYVVAVAIAALATESLTRGLTGLYYLAVVGFGLLVVLSIRLATRWLLRRARRSGKDYRNWAIVGWNDRARRLVETVQSHPSYGVKILEIVDFDRAQSDRPDLLEQGVRRIRSVRQFEELVAANVIDEVVVTVPLRSYYDEVQGILEICHDSGISVKLPQDGFTGAEAQKTQLVMVGELPLVTYYSGPADALQLALKRIIDIIGGCAGLLLLSPLFVAIAIAIKLDSRGPVLFRSERVGLHGRVFTMIKFRSMIQNAPALRDSLTDKSDTNGFAFKIRDDPRITRVGRVLRAFHLDELPQLWNVLTGDMSLVGPRPLPIDEAMGYESWQRRRLSMPPGLTCYWQIAGDHQMPFADWVRLDLAYIDRWSLWVDIKLILSTLRVLGRRQGW